MPLEPEGEQIEDPIMLRVPGRELPYLLLVFIFVKDEAIVLNILHTLQNEEPRCAYKEDKANLGPSEASIIELPNGK